MEQSENSLADFLESLAEKIKIFPKGVKVSLSLSTEDKMSVTATLSSWVDGQEFFVNRIIPIRNIKIYKTTDDFLQYLFYEYEQLMSIYKKKE